MANKVGSGRFAYPLHRPHSELPGTSTRAPPPPRTNRIWSVCREIPLTEAKASHLTAEDARSKGRHPLPHGGWGEFQRGTASGRLASHWTSWPLVQMKNESFIYVLSAAEIGLSFSTFHPADSHSLSCRFKRSFPITATTAF